MNYSRQRQLIFEAVHKQKCTPQTDSVYQPIKARAAEDEFGNQYLLKFESTFAKWPAAQALLLRILLTVLTGNVEPHCHLHCRVCSLGQLICLINDGIVRPFFPKHRPSHRRAVILYCTGRLFKLYRLNEHKKWQFNTEVVDCRTI
jgi:hypothetical protein